MCESTVGVHNIGVVTAVDLGSFVVTRMTGSDEAKVGKKTDNKE